MLFNCPNVLLLIYFGGANPCPQHYWDSPRILNKSRDCFHSESRGPDSQIDRSTVPPLVPPAQFLFSHSSQYETFRAETVFDEGFCESASIHDCTVPSNVRVDKENYFSPMGIMASHIRRSTLGLGITLTGFLGKLRCSCNIG